MIILHLLVALLAGVVALSHYRLNKLHEAYKTQGEINEVQKQAFDVLAESIGQALSEVDKELAKKANKRVSKKK